MITQAGFKGIPQCVVELGPGDSLGTGFMSVLIGARRYYAIDAVRHASHTVNVDVFDELVELLRNRTPIPSDGICADIRPELQSYAFPAKLFDDDAINVALSPSRIKQIREGICGDLPDHAIQYLAPFGEMSKLPSKSVDWIFSQAVMEHVDDPDATYRECFRCLRAGGIMSHQIDFKSHETAPEWNGHWKYSRWIWGLMRGRRPWFLNRIPHSAHFQMQRDAGLDVCQDLRQIQSGGIARHQLSRDFRSLSDSDLHIAGTLLVSVKTGVTESSVETNVKSRSATATST